MTTLPAVQAELDGEFTRSHHSSNLVNVPPQVLASCRFNDAPVALHIAGVREFNRGAFEMFAEAQTPAEAADAFENYMHAAFGIDPEQRDRSGTHRRFRSSYLRLLRGWAYDANSSEGAVLKGWVESRFGLLPTFHKQPLDAAASGVWATYVTEKMSTRFHDNSIYAQLDLLYEFGQWQQRRFGTDATHVTLYRGTNDFAEHRIVEKLDRRSMIVLLNNVVSFTHDRDIAGCFGDYILQARVPHPKILFANALLPRHPLKAEGEYLVIGGEYRVSVGYG
jgi:NAD+--dinitrogen-reductase ADP-D-ribosyltransferase